MKRRRRVRLGDLMTITFENTDTMRFQVQEMARAERMSSDEQIAQELAVYNELIPDEEELSATLFVEITDKDALREWLPKLVGIQRALSVDLGDAGIVQATASEEFLTREEDATSAVHYLKFAFTADQARALAEDPAALVVDHPAYEVRVPLADDVRRELAGDLGALASTT